MKITQTRLKEIIQEELAAVAAEGLSPDAMEEYTPMLPPRESAIAAAVGSIINGLRSGQLSAQGAADRLESQVKDKLYKLSLEEGELEEYGRPLNQPLNPDVARQQQADQDKKVKAAIEAGRGKYGQGAPPIKVGRRYEE